MTFPNDYIVSAANVRLQGFTVEELKRILQAIRDVEQYRPNRLIYVRVDCPELRFDEATELVKQIWPL